MHVAISKLRRGWGNCYIMFATFVKQHPQEFPRHCLNCLTAVWLACHSVYFNRKQFNIFCLTTIAEVTEMHDKLCDWKHASSSQWHSAGPFGWNKLKHKLTSLWKSTLPVIAVPQELNIPTFLLIVSQCGCLWIYFLVNTNFLICNWQR